MVESRGSRGNVGYALFRSALLDGRLSPGTTITQAELCEILGVSVSPLRDTLALLEADGMVEIRRRAGITVVTPDVGFIRANFQFRTLIEKEAILRFVETVESDWLSDAIAEHERVLSDIGKRKGLDRIEETLQGIDWDFHSKIVSALRNGMITETHYHLQQNLRLARVLNRDYAAPSEAAEALSEHLAILEHLTQRNPTAAATALETHFRAAIHRAFAG